MKKIKSTLILLLAIFASLNILGQTIPETFNYQAVARTNEGNPIINQEVILEVSILQGTDCETSGCNIVWQEIHKPTTNEFGLFSIQIGSGQTTFQGSATDFNSVDWYDVASGNYFMKMRVDFGSADYGNGLIDMGTVKLQSVPYALVSENSEDVVRDANGRVPFAIDDLQGINVASATNGQVLQWTGSEWIAGDVNSGAVNTLSEIGNVNVSPVSGDFLQFDGSNWINYQLSVDISDLTGLDLTGATNGDVLTFDGTNWVSTTHNHTLSDISDISLGTPANGEVLTFDGTNWVNQPASGGASLWTDNTDYISSPTGNGVLVSGSYGAGGAITPAGAGSRMMFFPRNASFRAGYVDGTQWNSTNLGDYSVAFGENNTASGNRTFAMGQDNTVSGNLSTAYGNGNTVQGIGNVVTGLNNTTTNASAYSLIAGENNNASAYSVLMVGDGNECTKQNSFSAGTDNIVAAENGFAIGQSNNPRGQLSAAFGLGNKINTYSGFFVGRYATFDNLASQTTWVASERLFVAGNGTGDLSRHDALVLYKDGHMDLEGVFTQGVGKNAKNANKISNPLETIFFLDGISYQNKGKQTFGIDVEGLEKVYPELVFDNSNGGKSISYTLFVPVLLEAVKEQQKTIEQLENENSELTQKYNELEKRLEIIEKQK